MHVVLLCDELQSRLVMLSIPRGICPHSIRRHHIINMSSSSLKRKQDHQDSPGSRQGQSDAKVPKRASAQRYTFTEGLPLITCYLLCPQSFLSSKSAERETMRLRIRSPSDGSRLPSVRRAVAYTVYTSPRPRLSALRRSTSMAPSSSQIISKWGAPVANNA
jgi:hypothetical protein